MQDEWEKKLDILGPITQAQRCLDQWLKEEGRAMTSAQKKRAAALMARYFQYEDEVTDTLMLSFLRHYSGKTAVDMEDPSSVRLEIKAVLDTAHPAVPDRRRWLAALLLLGALAAAGFAATQRQITREEQAELKALVRVADAADPEKTSAAIWREIKAPAGVRRYEDLTWWDYRRARKILAAKNALQNQ